ncbi:2OG-Fe dioxygenase family protein [Streptomyces huiliensis]|uniref:2OG-Fe dioxygenase family protein n=1 Tax=Streptomyces huiliensis TaxID=2876027 RepID=UPI001CBE96A5|nr:2OG-Fe dioxygenase family protein [Streptomyces huiliensis]MBZ4324214.1 2OG-Fe dioxygenase family protein [Streptomyces huiliensis]
MTPASLRVPEQPGTADGHVPPPFVHFPADLLAGALGALPPAAVTLFTESWNDLPADAHLGTDTPYRFRRYSRFRILPNGGLERLPHAAFFQDAAVNRVNGGVDRMFAPLAEGVAAGAALAAVVRTLRERLPGPREGMDGCGVHQIRVVATRDAEGHPAPEGVHQDGHCYVAQVLIRREGVEGADSRLYDLEREPVHEALLTTPFETIVLDDRRVFHGVTPIRPAAGAERGVRDMLLVDFFPLGD